MSGEPVYLKRYYHHCLAIFKCINHLSDLDVELRKSFNIHHYKIRRCATTSRWRSCRYTRKNITGYCRVFSSTTLYWIQLDESTGVGLDTFQLSSWLLWHRCSILLFHSQTTCSIMHKHGCWFIMMVLSMIVQACSFVKPQTVCSNMYEQVCQQPCSSWPINRQKQAQSVYCSHACTNWDKQQILYQAASDWNLRKFNMWRKF